MAVVDYFLKLDGVVGESLDAKHKGEIELESFSWGLAHGAAPAAGGGGAAGKVSFQDFHFVQKTQKSSPTLMQAGASGKHIPSALLTARKAGKEQLEFLKIKLTDVLVSSFQIAADDDYPFEQISLNFSKIEVSYSAQPAGGKSTGATTFGWDLKANKKV